MYPYAGGASEICLALALGAHLLMALKVSEPYAIS